MVISFGLFIEPRPDQVPGVCTRRPSGSTGPAAGTDRKSDLALVQTLRGPVLETRAQREAARSEDFLDFVERLATQVRGLEQFGLGTLDQVADVVDVLGLQAVRRTDRELELVDRTQQDRIELRRRLRHRLEHVADR